MANGDVPLLDIGETVQEFLNSILEQVVRGVEESRIEENRNCVQQVIENVIRAAIVVVEDEKFSSHQYSGKNQNDGNMKRVSIDLLEENMENCDDDRTARKEQENETTSPMSEKQHSTAIENISKSTYLPSRHTLHASLNRRTEEVEKAKIMDNKHSLNTVMIEYTQHASKGQQYCQAEETTENNSLEKETEKKNCNVIWNNNMSSLRTDTNVSDATGTNISEVTALATHLEDCVISYGRLQDQSINSLRSEYIRECRPNDTTDAIVRVKTDELKGKTFPKFSNVEKKKTRYGKVKIYYNGKLDQDEKKRIIKEATELLKYVKDKELEEKKQRKALETERENIGTRIRNFFRRLSCCSGCCAE
ncbi:uncharacterized protein LOC123533525 [Mercenaria mercenaria]|uniref:uncharacterized protein LOC123533525 n=1 Tax=Mercenaria mercenaria TaxID=6596 RepID=UPI00234F4A4F|nr:uncharacterized protein LOC123533525 [Mercenaria mercenaria]